MQSWKGFPGWPRNNLLNHHCWPQNCQFSAGFSIVPNKGIDNSQRGRDQSADCCRILDLTAGYTLPRNAVPGSVCCQAYPSPPGAGYTDFQQSDRGFWESTARQRLSPSVTKPSRDESSSRIPISSPGRPPVSHGFHEPESVRLAMVATPEAPEIRPRSEFRNACYGRPDRLVHPVEFAGFSSGHHRFRIQIASGAFNTGLS